jgi:hypothetical protein
MARETPRVDGATLIDGTDAAEAILVGTPAWYVWLDRATTFAFVDASGRFTARKERRQGTAGYWKAYRKHAGVVRSAYFGKTPDLALERLQTAAAALAEPSAPSGAAPGSARDLPPLTPLYDLSEHHLKDLSRSERIFQLMTSDLPSEDPPLSAQEAQPVQPAPEAAPLLGTKLYIPVLQPQLVPRPRLLARLTAGLAQPLTLLSAPAGFGKTTLVSAWHATAHGRTIPLAWVSLDSADRDPARFWSYVITALDRLLPGLAAETLPAIQFAPAPPIEGMLTRVLNALTRLPADAVLVLDDYHVIDSTPIHQAVAFLLDHLPARLHLVITTRADPPLPLARLRARGTLTELRAADLRFTPDEVATFLTEVMGLSLASDEVAALEARTEGWIAGLQLAALAMRDRADHAGFVAAFTGSNRFIVDYLVAEVLDRLPAHLQRFVLQTSMQTGADHSRRTGGGLLSGHTHGDRVGADPLPPADLLCHPRRSRTDGL